MNSVSRFAKYSCIDRCTSGILVFMLFWASFIKPGNKSFSGFYHILLEFVLNFRVFERNWNLFSIIIEYNTSSNVLKGDSTGTGTPLNELAIEKVFYLQIFAI